MKTRAILLLALLCTGCRSPRVGDVMREFGAPAYAKHVETGFHSIHIRYLPLALQVLNRAGWEDSLSLTRGVLDSLRRSQPFHPGLCFLMTLGPADTSQAKGRSNDVVYGSQSGYSDYREAIQAYQFGLKDKIWLETGGVKYPLYAYTLENSWGMTRSRNFFLSFRVPEKILTARNVDFQIVLDDIVPGLARRKITWTLPIGEYDALI